MGILIKPIIEKLLGKIESEEMVVVPTKIEMDINSSYHSTGRQHQRKISNDEITNIVIKASDNIINDFISGKLKLDQSIHIYDKRTHINIFGKLYPKKIGKKEILKFLIMTQYERKNRKPKEGHLFYEV